MKLKDIDSHINPFKSSFLFMDWQVAHFHMEKPIYPFEDQEFKISRSY